MSEVNELGQDLTASIRTYIIICIRKNTRKCVIIFSRFIILYIVEKTGMLKCFCNSSGTNIGADTSSQTRSSE